MLNDAGATAQLELRVAVRAGEIRDLVERIGLIDTECVIGTEAAVAFQLEGGDRLRFAREIIIEGELGVDDVGIEGKGTTRGLEIGHDDGAVQRIDEINGVGIDVEVEPAGRGVALHPERPGVEAAVEGPGGRRLRRRLGEAPGICRERKRCRERTGGEHSQPGHALHPYAPLQAPVPVGSE